MNIYAQHESAPESQLLIIESEESKIASFYTGRETALYMVLLLNPQEREKSLRMV